MSDHEFDAEPTPRETREESQRYRVSDEERLEHYAAYPPGTPPVAEIVNVPHNAFEAELARRQNVIEMHVASLLASRRSWRWVAGLGIPSLVAAALTLLLYSADKVASSAERVGETRAEIDGLKKRLDEQHQEILFLRKLSGVDPVHPDASLSYRFLGR